MRKYYLAIDIGRSSGRHLLGTIEDNGKITVSEIYSFSSQVSRNGEYQAWDLKDLMGEIIKGMKECKRKNKIPYSVGITGEGDGIVVLDEKNEVLAVSLGAETEKVDEWKKLGINEWQFYQETGRFLNNHLPAVRLIKMKQEKKKFAEAASVLLLPDYLHFLLSGKKVMEYTNALEAGLINPKTGGLCEEILKQYEISTELFSKIHYPETCIGKLCQEVRNQVGYDTKVILPSTNSLYSALLAIPAKREEFMFVQSETWACLGCAGKSLPDEKTLYEERVQLLSGYDPRRYVYKPVPGLWMLQCIRMEYGDVKTGQEVIDLASRERNFPSLIDVEKPVFRFPLYVVKSIREECERTKQKVPLSLGEVAQVAIASIILSYQKEIKELESLLHVSFERIYLMGEGADQVYLNDQIASATNKEVCFGIQYISALGNILVQMLYGGEFLSLEKARRCVRRSFEIKREKGEIARQKMTEGKRKQETGHNKKKIQITKRL
ncbi:MAG: hypothetical protein E7256_07145 [Lachnospiraceae bacterium]|nr:hypothetical protein [Lachnospiraceae bacterium]